MKRILLLSVLALFVINACGEDRPRSPTAPLFGVAASLDKDFRQCANNDAPSPPYGLGTCHWIGSILQTGNAKYFEGMSTLQRLILVNITATTGNLHTLTFRHQSAKSNAGSHSYDYLTSWDQAVAAANALQPPPRPSLLATLVPCGPEPSSDPSGLLVICNSLRTGVNSQTVPAPDAMGTVLGDNVAASITAYEAKFGNRTIKIYGNAAISSPTLSFNGYTSGSDPDAQYTLTWTSTSNQILIEFAGHIAVGTDPLSAGIGYGPGKGAANISGGPYHIFLDLLDGSSLGNQDNQIKGADIIAPPDLTVTKTADASPVNAGSQIGFTITVQNAVGVGTATAASLTDALPGGTGIVWSISPAYGGPGTCSITGTAPAQTLGCTFGDLAAGATASVHVISATTAVSCAVYNNSATVAATNSVTVPPATASITVQCPTLEVTKTANASPVNAGSQIGFTIVVSNTGAGTATAASLTDALPGGTGIDWSISPAYGGPGTCSITGTAPAQTLGCTFGDLAAGASASVHVTSPTTAATACTDYANTATANATNLPAPVEATASITVQCPQITGKTPGYWGNKNGIAQLDPDHDGTIGDDGIPGLPVTIGGTVGTETRTATVGDTGTNNRILRKNACTSVIDCTSRSDALMVGTLNTLAAQTLALAYNTNEALLHGYSSSTIGSLGCVPVLGMLPSTSVGAVLTKANNLIANSVSGVNTTQSEAGQMNTLLACLNREQ